MTDKNVIKMMLETWERMEKERIISDKKSVMEAVDSIMDCEREKREYKELKDKLANNFGRGKKRRKSGGKGGTI